MAFSLWNTIQDSLGDNITTQISSLLGADKSKTQSGLQAAIPTILKSVISASKTEDGTAMLENELDSHDGSLLGKLNDVVSPEMGRTFAEDGTNLFHSFAGADATKATAALSRASGLGAGASRSMLGIMTPVVMGAIAKHRRVEKLDSAQLLSCLDNQLVDVEQSIGKLGQVATTATTGAAAAVGLAATAGGAAIAGSVPEKLKALVKQCHDEFGPGEAITERVLAHRLNIPAESAGQLLRDLRAQAKINPATGALTDAPTIADTLVQKAADAFTSEERVTAPLLESRLGLRRQRSESLLEDLKSRQLIGATGAWSKRSTIGNTAKKGGSAAATRTNTAVSAREESQVQSAPAESGGLGWLLALLLPLFLIGAVIWGLYAWSTGRDKRQKNTLSTAVGAASESSDGQIEVKTDVSKLKPLTDDHGISTTDAVDVTLANDPYTDAVDDEVADAAANSEASHDVMNDDSHSTTSVLQDDDDATDDEPATVGSNTPADGVAASESSLGSNESNGTETQVATDGVVQASATAAADASSEVTEVLRQLTRTLDSVDGVSAAKDSIPKLTKWTTELEQIAKGADQWDTSIRSSVDEQLRKLLPTLGDSIDTMLSDKTISGVMQKPVEGLLQTIDQLIPKN